MPLTRELYVNDHWLTPETVGTIFAMVKITREENYQQKKQKKTSTHKKTIYTMKLQFESVISNNLA